MNAALEMTDAPRELTLEDAADTSVTVKTIEAAFREVPPGGEVERREAALLVLTRRGPFTLARSGILDNLEAGALSVVKEAGR